MQIEAVVHSRPDGFFYYEIKNKMRCLSITRKELFEKGARVRKNWLTTPVAQWVSSHSPFLTSH